MRIILTIFLASLMYLPMSVNAACSGASCCVVASGGVTTAPAGDSCETEPESYGITLYEKYLCIAMPTTPLASVGVGPRAYDLEIGTKCFQTFSSSAGSTVDILSTSTSVSFDGTFTRPPNGAYTHGVMLIKNEFRIKQDMEINASITADTGTSGQFCETTGNTGAESDGNSLTCSGADGSAVGTFTSIMSTFGGDCTSFDGDESFTFPSGDIIAAWLLDTDNHLAESCAEVVAKDRLFGVQTFANPVVVSKDTNGFNMAFGVSSGSNFMQNPDGKYSVGSGPFKVIITPTSY